MPSSSLLSVLLSALLLLAHVSQTVSQSATLTFTQQTSAAPFSGRANGNVESLGRAVAYVANNVELTAVNPLILQGSDNTPGENDVWLSPNNGVNWYLLAGIARNTPGGPYNAPGNAAQSSFRTAAGGASYTTDGFNNIFRIQGQASPVYPWEAGTCSNETWVSMDGGVNWQLRSTTQPSPSRKFAASISDSRNNIYVLGGQQCPDWATLWDVWMSSNQGATWQRRTPFSGVDGPAVGILLNVPVAPRATGLSITEALLYTTGYNNRVDYNTVWLSSNQGTSWVKYPLAAAFSARDDANAEVTKEGLIVLVGGKHEYTVNTNVTEEFYNDVWVSPDGGYTWGLCVEDAPFSDRRYFMTVLDQSGYLYVIGGADAAGTRLNDVYRSSISFSNLADVQRVCGITEPACGYGLTCLPDDPTTRKLPRGVTCAAAERCGGAVQSNSVDFTPQTTRAPWSPRSSLFVGRLPLAFTYSNGNANVQAPANSFILHGNTNFRENDVWLSTDRMETWNIISGVSLDGVGGGGTAPAPGGASSFRVPVARGPAYSIATYNGNNRLYRISGETVLDTVCSNEVWTSINGVQWSVITVANAWTPRIWAQSVVSARDGSVYLFGGRSCGQGGGSLFDVWRSANNGQSWTQQSNNFPAEGPRNGMSGIWYSTILGREVITYASGWAEGDYNDVVVSSDQGVSWAVVTNAATWVRRDDMAGLQTADGILILVGGKTNRQNQPEEFHNDIWVSMDGGYSFGRCNEDTAFSDRRYTTAEVDEQGYLYVVGGQTNDRNREQLLADAWRSTLSFSASNLQSISAACNVTVPTCGPGLNCWPGAPGTQRLPGNKGVTCPACPTTANINGLDFLVQSRAAPFSARSQGNVELFNKAITYTPVGSTQQVTAPRNSLVLQGTSNGAENDVWVSTDHGLTWNLIAGRAVYSRGGTVSASAPADSLSFSPNTLYTAFAYDSINNYIYRIAGYNPATGQCWGGAQYSSDGKKWVNVNTGNSNSISPTREYAAAITDSKGYVYVTGGRMCGTTQGLEDVWRSTDRGASWTRRTGVAPWGWRLSHLLLNVQAKRISGQPDVLITMGGWTGGSDRNDVWASTDGGAKWELITLGAAWDSRDDMNGEVTPAGLLIVSGGKSEKQVGAQRVTEVYNDVWVSADGGYTWGACINDATFDDRRYQMTVLDEEGYLIIIGGVSSSEMQLNDVWRSSISFTNLPAVQRACGITVPSCGLGLSCLPSSPGFRRLPGNMGVSCDACRNNAGYNRMDFVRLSGEASWSPRSHGNAELMTRSIQWHPVAARGALATAPANSLVLLGNDNYRENDVWISTDHGVVWELLAGWSLYGRNGDVGAYGDAFLSSFTPDTYAPAFLVDSRSAIYRIQGETTDGGSCSRDVWMATDGVHWVNQYTNATQRRITPERLYAGGIGDSKGNIYVAGGRACSAPGGEQERNDVWMSSDRGKNWALQTTAAPWGRRAVFQFLSQNSPALQKDVLMVFAGWSGSADYNDVWASSDQGRSWRMLTAQAPWMSRDDANAEITSKGLIILTSGKSQRRNAQGQTYDEILNDVWVSADGGYTWGSCLQDASYSDRRYQMTLLDENNYLYVMGGEQSNGRKLNDVWRSSLSFDDLNAVQATCGIRIPTCGPGLNCWYNSPGFMAGTRTRSVTCDACENMVNGPTGASGTSGGTGTDGSSSSSGLGTGALLAIVILAALGVAGAYFGYRYWNRIGADNKPADGLLANEMATTREGEASTNGSSSSSEGTYTAPAASQPTV